MSQLSFFQPASWTVNDLTAYLKDLLESDHTLAKIWPIMSAASRWLNTVLLCSIPRGSKESELSAQGKRVWMGLRSEGKVD